MAKTVGTGARLLLHHFGTEEQQYLVLFRYGRKAVMLCWSGGACVTAAHASWLNQVERLFALLTQLQIKRGSHRSVQELKAAIQEFIVAHNQQPKPFSQAKSADQILASIARFATAILAAYSAPTSTRNQ